MPEVDKILTAIADLKYHEMMHLACLVRDAADAHGADMNSAEADIWAKIIHAAATAQDEA